MKFPECSHCGTRLIPESPWCPGCGKDVDLPGPIELRCECGFLLCKLSDDAIEVKCRRCKRLVNIPVDSLPERYLEDKRKMAERKSMPPERRPGERDQRCMVCGKAKPNMVYGKCLDCRTADVKVQYKGRGPRYGS